jgi:leucine dehydrogenase
MDELRKKAAACADHRMMSRTKSRFRAILRRAIRPKGKADPFFALFYWIASDRDGRLLRRRSSFPCKARSSIWEAVVDIFETLSALDFGELHFGHDTSTGLRAIVALHSTRLGPAIGGCRIRAYTSEAEAIEDAVRLGRAMTYKAALAGLPNGGGKAVIWAPKGYGTPGFDERARVALFAAFGRFVDGLGGRYITCEDAGTSVADMDHIRRSTRHVLGASSEQGGSGDPSPFTALGVRRGIEAIAERRFGRKDLNGLRVAIQGVGHVGLHLGRELKQAGAELIISDLEVTRVKAAATELDATIAPPDQILTTECDVLAPCALGGAITEALVPQLRCKVVAGAANNQLRTAGAGRALAARGIFYAPDYAINAGGLINVAAEYEGYDRERARQKILQIYDTIADLLARSQEERVLPEVMADRMVQERLAAGPR